mmetsp:Transcript_144819/g.361150  ORF Transcript_144819/g.361150 Transcript_144819/m.361150 type:complete len:259 (-) Transcript_144819:654-1430(-)
MAYADPHVARIQEVQSHILHLSGECGREHHGVPPVLTFWRRHPVFFNDAANLGLKAHVQHAIGLVKRQVLDILDTDDATSEKVLQAAWSADCNVTTFSESLQLRHSISTAVYGYDTDGRAEAEPSSLHANLLAELTRWCQNNCSGADGTFYYWLRPCAHHGSNDGHQKRSRLAATCLSAHHYIGPSKRSWDAMFLHGSRHRVRAPLKVGNEGVRQVKLVRSILETLNWFLLTTATGPFNRNAVILVEVDTHTHVRRLE